MPPPMPVCCAAAEKACGLEAAPSRVAQASVQGPLRPAEVQAAVQAVLKRHPGEQHLQPVGPSPRGWQRMVEPAWGAAQEICCGLRLQQAG